MAGAVVEPAVQAAVANALAEVRQRIGAACDRAGRASGEVALIGVSKFQPTERVQAAVACGLLDLGENRAQDLLRRVADLEGASGVRWHFLGPLQRNKTRAVAELATAFHALERLEVASRLSRQRPDHLPPLAVYVEVNLAGEASKAGVAPADAPALVDAVRDLPGLRAAGLMAMPPAAAVAADNRRWFAELRALGERCGVAGLSMGTSADYEVAVEEGATAVRVGRQLFGDR